MSTEDRLRGVPRDKGGEMAGWVGGEPIQEEKRRRSWLVAVVAAAAVLVVIGGIGLFARSGNAPFVDETAETTAALASITPSTGPSLTWTEVQGPGLEPESHATAILSMDDGFVAITESWDPDSDTPRRGAWHSRDGVTWVPVEMTGLDSAQVNFHTITRGGSGFVAVGMEFGEPPSPYGPGHGTFLAWTSSDGLTWEAHTLPQPDLTAPDPLVTWYSFADSVAASDTGIVAVGRAYADLMVEEIVADHLGISLDEAMEISCGYGFGGGSLEVFACGENPEDSGYQEEILFEVTFDELGLSAEAQQLIDGAMRSLVWYSPDGTTWDLLDAPFGSEAFVSSVVATDDGFCVVSHGPAGPVVWSSTDGRRWEPTGDVLDDGGIDRVFARDGVLYATGWQGDGTALWSSTDGVTWTGVDLGGAFDAGERQYSINELLTGGLGLVGQVDFYVDPFIGADPVVFEVDGLEVTMWLAEYQRVRIVDPATGAVLLDEGPWEYEPLRPFQLERDGYRLEMDLKELSATLTELATGEVVLETGEPTEYGEPEGLRFDDQGSYIFFDPETDEVFLTVPWEEINEILDLSPPWVRGDPNGIHYIDPETGQEIVTVPVNELNRVMDETIRTSEGSYAEPKTGILFSPTGTAWSLQPTAAALGQAGWIEAIAVGDDAVIAVFRPHGDGYPPPAQWWIGTLKN